MNLVFVAPNVPRPNGGVAVIYEFAKSMARRGHETHLFHVANLPGIHHASYLPVPVSGVEQISWFDFGDVGVVHHFALADEYDHETLRRCDIYFGYKPDDTGPRVTGLPVVLIQGYRLLNREFERRAFHSPCPKVCVSKWLVDVGCELGVPERELVHVPLGLRHEKYRLVSSVRRRPPRISFCYSPHWHKGASVGLEVLARVKQTIPEVEAVAFGTTAPEHDVPGWIDFRLDPSQTEIVRDIYNASRVFLCTSEVEGFGLPALEAMACGAAVVTTDNGGSREYALHGQTALVAEPGDVDALVGHVVELLTDDERRTRIADAGLQHVRRFDWDASAALLEEFLERYRADPQSYGLRRAAG